VTLAAVEESLRRMGAAEVLTAVFADKLNGKQKPIAADFIGLTVPDRFVFGFGMDAGGVWRNLPAVYAMKDAE
jgi:hypoxanthine phosphoribosyltransferase